MKRTPIEETVARTLKERVQGRGSEKESDIHSDGKKLNRENSITDYKKEFWRDSLAKEYTDGKGTIIVVNSSRS